MLLIRGEGGKLVRFYGSYLHLPKAVWDTKNSTKTMPKLDSQVNKCLIWRRKPCKASQTCSLKQWNPLKELFKEPCIGEYPKVKNQNSNSFLPSKLYVLYMKILWLLVFNFNLNKFYMITNKITSPIGFLIKFKFKHSMNAKNKKSWSKLGWWIINKYRYSDY